MNVPPFKMDHAKGHNSVWLVENLRKRNADHPAFAQVMAQLLEFVETKCLMKRSLIERYRQQLESA